MILTSEKWEPPRRARLQQAQSTRGTKKHGDPIFRELIEPAPAVSTYAPPPSSFARRASVLLPPRPAPPRDEGKAEGGGDGGAGGRGPSSPP